MTEWSAYVAFWGFASIAVICLAAPRIIRASFEGMCEHEWEKIWEGTYRSTEGEPMGCGRQYRCTHCGAERSYR